METQSRADSKIEDDEQTLPFEEEVSLLATALLAESEKVYAVSTSSTAESVSPSGFAWLTVERLLYGLLLVIALLIRFLELGALPLSTLEATNAWRAWLSVWGDGTQIGAGATTAVPIASSALLYSFHTILLWLIGGGDALVRFVPALFGSGLVLLPWLWRATVGRQMALLLALLLAIDPWLVAYSRLADGTILSIFFGLLTLTGLHLLLDRSMGREKRRRWQLLTATSAGLLLVSGTQAWSMVLVLALFVLFFDLNIATLLSGDVEPEEAVDEVDSSSIFASDSAAPDAKNQPVEMDAETADNGSTRGIHITPLIALVVAILLGSTAWLARLEGAGFVSSSISFWVAQLSGSQSEGAPAIGALYPISWVGLRLLIDQPFLLVFGLAGLVLGLLARRRGEWSIAQKRWSSFVVGWLLVGVFLLLLPGRGPFSLFMIGLPLLVAAAYTLNRVITMARSAVGQLDGWILLVLLAVLTFSGNIYLNVLVGQRQFNGSTVLTIVAIFAIALLSVILYSLWATRQEAVGIAGLFVALLLLSSTLSSSWSLAHRFDLQEPNAFFAHYTDPDVRRLAENIAMLSARRVGDAGEMPVQVQLRAEADPLLGWYLREMRNLSWSPAPAADAATTRKPLLITYLDSGYDGQANENYLSGDFGLRLSWLPSQLPHYQPPPVPPEGSADAPAAGGGFLERMNNRLSERWSSETQPLLRWMRYRKIPGMPPSERVLLWVPPNGE